MMLGNPLSALILAAISPVIVEAAYPTATGTYPNSTATTAGLPVQTGFQLLPCKLWQVAYLGDTCAEMATENGLVLAEFLKLNPQIGSSTSDCQTKFWAGYLYCVKGVAANPTKPSGTGTYPSSTQAATNGQATATPGGGSPTTTTAKPSSTTTTGVTSPSTDGKFSSTGAAAPVVTTTTKNAGQVRMRRVRRGGLNY